MRVNVLGVRSAGLDQSDGRSRAGADVYAWLDWTVDGKSLRSKYSQKGTDDTDITLLHARDLEDEPFRTESLRRLRGDTLSPPTFEPRFYRTRLDRLLHRRGTPYAPAGTAFEDGRVGLLYCYCGDLDCGALSTRVEVTAETINWRDIGWQVTYEPYTPYDEVQQWLGDRDLTFDRAPYESLINRLLEADWSHGLPQL